MALKRSPNRSRSSAASIGLSTLAVALACTPRPALAQFNASGTVVTGAASGLATDRIIVATPYTEINWTTGSSSPSGGGADVDFLSAGKIVTFWDGARTGDYTVLNRVFPTDPTSRIVFNGTVNSLVGLARGGSVWFYAPGGMLVSSTGVFNVGNLLLSTGSISCAAGSSCQTVLIDGAPGGTKAVEIAPNAVLSSAGYTAIVAPRIRQDGLIRSGGPAALVAGEDVTLTIRSDLFDIVINVGAYSDPTNPNDNVMISHTGETLSNSVQGAGQHRVFIAGVAQLDPMSILLGGTVQARDAEVTANGIVLSAGGDIVGGQAIASGTAGAPVDLVIGPAPPTHAPDPLGDVYPHLTSANLVARATGSILLQPGASLRTGGNMTLTAGDDITVGGSRIDGGSVLTVTAGRDVFVDGASQIQGGTIAVRAGDDIGLGSSTSMAAGSGGMVLAANDAAARGSRAFGPGNVAMLSAAGALTSAGAMQLSGEAVEAQNASAASIAISTNANVAGATNRAREPSLSTGCGSGAACLGNVSATNALTVNAGGLAQVSGLATGQSVAITSADIAIGAGGRIGNGSQTVTLTPVTTGGVFVGDSSGTGGYRLDGAEAGRLQANRIVIAPASSDVTIGTMTLQGSQATGTTRPGLFGADGTFHVETGGSILVNGAVQVANMGDANRLELVAGQWLTQVIPAGSIALRNSAGGLGGVLLMRGRNVLVADSSIQDQERTTPLFTGRDAALATNSGGLAADGYVSARQFIGEASESLHVQNTNTGGALAREFGGIRAQSLTINATGGTTAPTDLILYGRQLAADGSVLVADFRLRDSTARTGSFTPGSSINGCLLTAPSCLAEDLASIVPILDTLNAITGTEQQGNVVVRPPQVPLAQLVDATEFEVTEPIVIDEPVTGAGNPETWQIRTECPEEDRERCH